MLRWNQPKAHSWPFKSQKEIKENINNALKKHTHTFIRKAKGRLSRSRSMGIFSIHERPLWIHTSILCPGLQCWKWSLPRAVLSGWRLVGESSLQEVGRGVVIFKSCMVLSCLLTVNKLTELYGSAFWCCSFTETFTVKSHVLTKRQHHRSFSISLCTASASGPCVPMQNLSRATSPIFFLSSSHVSS